MTASPVPDIRANVEVGSELLFSDNHGFWVKRAELLQGSPQFRSRFERLESIAHAPRRFTPRLAELELDKIDELCNAAGARNRPGQHRDLPVDPEYGNDHATTYRRGLIQLAAQTYGATVVGARLMHDAIRMQATALPVPTDAASWPAPAGPAASGAAAPWLGETAPTLERAWQRWRRDRFNIDVKGPL